MANETLLSSFEVIDTVSSSADSDVSVVRDRKSGEFFLLKDLKSSQGWKQADIDRKIRFKRELDLVSSLDHPNIARPAFSFENNQSDIIAYPYRKGKTLASLFSDGMFFHAPDALHIGRQLLDALEHIHARGIIHCDINPNNLFIDNDKGLQLLDFGMAMGEDEAMQMPEGRVVGTMPWLSPEQMGFTAFKVDSRADLYCAALVLYRLLSGKMAFTLNSNSVEELLNFALRLEVQPLHKVPLSVNAMLLKALKPTPSERYQTAAGFKHDLLAAIDHVRNGASDRFTSGRQDAIIAANRSRLFVARAHEVESLKEGHRQLLRGSAVSFCIHGKSGIGKSEIVREFRRSLREGRAFLLSTKCNALTPQQPYALVRHLTLDFIANINKRGASEAAAFAVTAEKMLADYSGVICKILPEMRPFFKIVRPIDIVDPSKEADRTAHVIFTLFSTLCSFKPLMIYIDDLQWIDRVSFDIVRRLLRNEVRCMLITTLRTDNLDGDLHVYEYDLRKIGLQKFLPLMSFSRAEIKDLVTFRFGESEDMEKIVDLLATRTDRSPFALAEALRFLVGRALQTTSGKEWWFSESEAMQLPERLDPVALVLQKTRDLTPDEREWLEIASLVDGKFHMGLIEKVGNFPALRSAAIVERLETMGFICPRFGGGYRFTQDAIQESVRGRIARERKLALHEKFGEVYETMAETDNEYLFYSAEAWLKSRNLSKAIALCYKAARHAADQVALDIASRYYGKTQLMASQCEKVGVAVPIDAINMLVEFGDVLMLTGRNEQGLKVYKGILNREQKLERLVELDIKYKIGTIYHNTGDFERSTHYFFDGLKLLHITFPINKLLTVVSLCLEILKQLILPQRIISFFKKQNNSETELLVKTLNKLSWSLFFNNLPLGLLVHFKALNISDCLKNDCCEKAESYAYHIIGSFSLLIMKKRAFSYFKKAINLANKINRKDIAALAYSFGGATNYYNAHWKDAEENLNASIATYKKIGDKWGPLVPLETLSFLNLHKGNFPYCKRILSEELNIAEDCQDKRGIAGVHMLSTFLKALEAKDVYQDWGIIFEEKENSLSDIPLNKTSSNLIILKKFLLSNQLKGAYDLSDSILYSIKQNNLIQEYVAGAYSDRCEILIKEFYNRKYAKEPEQQLPLSNRALLHELRKFMIAALLRGILYPAHRGAAYRASAWYYAFKKHPLLARYFFKKAINLHHNLDMQYEEAKSLRDYGLFFEHGRHPGLARDLFNRAYKLFDDCGALLESGRIEDKVDAALVRHHDTQEKKEEISTFTTEAIDQVRVDTLYDASLSLTRAEDIDTLLRRTVGLLIRATGAQFGYLRLDGDEQYEAYEIALNFDNKVLPRESASWPDIIMRRAIAEKRIVRWPDPSLKSEGLRDPAMGDEGSALCVPLFRGDRCLGGVYLANKLVAGLFSDNAAKAAQIIAGQAGFLIENIRLVEEYKRLTGRLEDKVKEQTRSIRDKNDQLVAGNLKLIESERMKDLLTGTIVHDIKNFAAGISGHVKLLSFRYGDDKKAMRNIDLAIESCADIVNLASNLLDISKMEEGKLALQQRRIYFEEIAAIARKYSSNVLFDEKKITVTLTPPPRDFAVLADPYLIERVVQNLFSNAAKYTDAGGSVEVSFDEAEGEDRLTFFSSGSPISPEHRETVFEKFSRIDGKSTYYSKGLGLFFCKIVMNAHQGRIWLDTDSRGNYFRLGFKKI